MPTVTPVGMSVQRTTDDADSNNNSSNNNSSSNKRLKVMGSQEQLQLQQQQQQQQQRSFSLSAMSSDDPLPLPMEPFVTRQSSLFRFLNSSGIFGSSDARQQQQQQQQQQHMMQMQQGFNGDGFGKRSSAFGLFSFSRSAQREASASAARAPAGFGDDGPFCGAGSVMGRMELEQKSASMVAGIGDNDNHMDPFDPVPINDVTVSRSSMVDDTLNEVTSSPWTVPPTSTREGRRMAKHDGDDDEDFAASPSKGLTSQVSDWLTSFLPAGKGLSGGKSDVGDESPAPPPPGGDESLTRSISSSIFGLVESPSIFLTNLKSGVTSIFGDPFGSLKSSSDLQPIPIHPPGFFPQNQDGSGNNGPGPIPILGEAPSSKRDSLLDDYEETPMEMELRNVRSR
jgi:hypothetical protein